MSIITYSRVENNDKDIAKLLEFHKLEEISRFISIDFDNYFSYVTSADNVFYYKIYNDSFLIGALHCEFYSDTLYLSIFIVPQYQNKGFASAVLQDIIDNKFNFCFKKIQVSIDKDNVYSRNLFENKGFVACGADNELIDYIYKTN